MPSYGHLSARKSRRLFVVGLQCWHLLSRWHFVASAMVSIAASAACSIAEGGMIALCILLLCVGYILVLVTADVTALAWEITEGGVPYTDYALSPTPLGRSFARKLS